MANIIHLAEEEKDSIHMSNGLTDVFINVLVISGSKIAKTITEKQMIVWLAEKDQSKVGIGTVGFDICSMPWNIQTFQKDKMFLLEVIAQAKNKIGWECLDYTPNEEMLFDCLDKFTKLISKMNENDIQTKELEKWLSEAPYYDPIICGFPLCPKHHTLLTIFGCHICNN